MTFASPGLTDLGTASASAKSTTKTGSGALTCTGKDKGSGTLAKGKIKSTSTTTCASDPNPPSPCPAGDYVYDSAGQFASTSGSLATSDPHTSWTIGSTTYTTDNTSSASASCPGTEVGFVLSGHLTAPAAQSGQPTTITACLDGDSGTGTTNSFSTDLFGELGGNTATIITSATFDPTASSIVIN